MKAEYTQVVVNKAELLKHIIKEQLKKDVNRVNRDRLLIEARFIYFHILREDEQMVYQKIGDTVGMNHASVLHGCQGGLRNRERSRDKRTKRQTKQRERRESKT